MRITEKGQVTIPKEVREQAGLLPGMDVDFKVDGRKVTLLPRLDPAEMSKREIEILEHLERMRGSIGDWTSVEVMRLTRGDD